MHHVTKMLETHPQAVANEALARCVEQSFACTLTCTSCADVCNPTGRVLTRQTSSEPRLARSMLEACAQACRVCAEECERHAHHHEHCRICAEACRRCEQACEDLHSSIGA